MKDKVDKLKRMGSKMLDRVTVVNGKITAEQLADVLREYFPEYKITPKTTSLGVTTVKMKKGFVEHRVVRGRGESRIYVQAVSPGCLASTFTLGIATLANSLGQSKRSEILQVLQDTVDQKADG